ncbi:MAG: hypothetical protein DRH49_07040 [Candidatus Coatesbacteria bacterium]|nr:MAG: hypothetical protein DRH49_07040 [Candidatus Coatesbacteria bacterium]
MEGILAMMIPIAAIVLGIGLGFYGAYLRHRAYVERKNLIEKAIEKGLDPKDLIKELGEMKIDHNWGHRTYEPARYLKTALILMGVGIGLALPLYFAVDPDVAWWSALPFFIGLAHLIYYFLIRNRKKPRPE